MRLIRWPCSTSLYHLFLFAYFLKKKASRQYKSAFLVIDDDTPQPLLLLLLLLLLLQLLVNNKILHFLMKMHDTTQAYLGILHQRHGIYKVTCHPLQSGVCRVQVHSSTFEVQTFWDILPALDTVWVTILPSSGIHGPQIPPCFCKDVGVSLMSNLIGHTPVLLVLACKCICIHNEFPLNC